MKPFHPVANMEDNVLIRILEYAWVGLFAMFAWVVKKLSFHDKDIATQNTSVQLLIQAQAMCDKTRDEDVERNEASHAAIMKALDTHHTTVMGRLDVLASKD